MIIAFPAKDGGKPLQFDIDSPDFKPEHIVQYAVGETSIRGKDGAEYKIPASKIDIAGINWIRENSAKQEYKHPRDIDEPLFSWPPSASKIGAAVKERVIEAAGGSLTGDTTAARAGQAFKKTAVGLAGHLADAAVGTSELVEKASVATPIGQARWLIERGAALAGHDYKKNQKTKTDAAKKMADDFFEEQLKSAGGADFYSGLGEFIGFVATAVPAAGGASAMLTKAAPRLVATKTAQKAIVEAVAKKQGGKALALAAKTVPEQFRKAFFVDGLAGLMHGAVMSGGDPEAALKEGAAWAVTGGVLRAVGAPVSALKGAKRVARTEAEAAAIKTLEAENAALEQAAREKFAKTPITDPRRQLPPAARPMPGKVDMGTMTMERVRFELGDEALSGLPDISKPKRPYSKPTVTEIQPGARKTMDVEPAPFTGEYLRRGGIEKTRGLYRERTPAEQLAELELPATSPEAYMSLAQQRPGEAGFIKPVEVVEKLNAWRKTLSAGTKALMAGEAKIWRDFSSAMSSDISATQRVDAPTFLRFKELAGAAKDAESRLKYGEIEAGLTKSKRPGGRIVDERVKISRRAEPYVEHPTTTAPSFVKAGKTNTAEIGDEYLYALTMRKQLEHNKEWTLPEPYTKEIINKVISNVETILPKEDPAAFKAIMQSKKASREFTQYEREMGVKLGWLGRGDITSMEKFYGDAHFPLVKHVDDVINAEGGGGGVVAAFKRRSAEGDKQTLVSDPMKELTERHIVGYAMMKRNQVYVTTVDKMLKHPELKHKVKTERMIAPGRVVKNGGDILEEVVSVSQKANRSKGEFFIRRIGQDGHGYYEKVTITDPYMKRAFIQSGKIDLGAFNWLSDVAKWFAKIKRGGIVLTPAFSARNIKKGIEQLIVMKPGSKATDGLGEFGLEQFQVWTKDVPVAIYNVMRTAYKTLNGKDPASLKMLPGEFYEELFMEGMVQRGAGGMIEPSKLAFAETSIREVAGAQAMVAALKRGATPQQAIHSAVMAFRETGGDFGEKGWLVRYLAPYSPFFNATIAGMRSDYRAAMKDPMGYTARALQIGVLPEVIHFIAKKDEEEYQAMPATRRMLQRQANIFGLNVSEPRGFGPASMLGAITGEMLRAMWKINPVEAESMAMAIKSYLIALPTPPVKDLYYIKKEGKDPFTKTPIDPVFSEKTVPHLRYQPYTSEVSKDVTRLLAKTGFEASPARLDAYIRAVFGAYGETGLVLGSKALKAAKGKVQEPFRMADIRHVIPFTSRSPITETSSAYQQRLYKYATLAAQRYNEHEKYQDEGLDFDATNAYRKYGKLIDAHDSLQIAVSEISDRNKELRDLENTVTTPLEMRRESTRLRREMYEIARQAVEEFEGKKK